MSLFFLIKDIIEKLYDTVRQWQDEEERFSNAIIDITESLILKIRLLM